VSGPCRVRVVEFSFYTAVGKIRTHRAARSVCDSKASCFLARPPAGHPAHANLFHGLLLRPDQIHGQSPYMSRLNGQVYDQTKSAGLSETRADPTSCRARRWNLDFTGLHVTFAALSVTVHECAKRWKYEIWLLRRLAGPVLRVPSLSPLTASLILHKQVWQHLMS